MVTMTMPNNHLTRYEKYLELGFPTFARGFKVDLGAYKMPAYGTPESFVQRCCLLQYPVHNPTLALPLQ